MIRNVVFDMGNVLIRFDRELFVSRVEVSPEDEALLWREVFGSLEWAMMDRGSLAEAEACERICSRLPERLHPAVNRLVWSWEQPMLPVPGMAELVRELKAKGYGVYLLSNATVRQHEYWPDIPGSECFDGTLISADVKLVKPQSEIFRCALERFGLRAEECVFVDDLNLNVEAAVFCGYAGIVFYNDVTRLRRELRALGVSAEQ